METIYKVQFLDKDVPDMTMDDVKREIRCQKAMLHAVQQEIWWRTNQMGRAVKESTVQRHKDSLALLENVRLAVLGFIELLEERKKQITRTKKQAKERIPKKDDIITTKDQYRYRSEEWGQDKNYNPFAWDSEKLYLVARDRGILTREGLAYYVSQNLHLTYRGTERLIETGRLTWGQTLALGALLEMTPKEFCDTFLSGYFVEVTPDNFRANVKNIDELLVRLRRNYAKEERDRQIKNGDYFIKTKDNDKKWQHAIYDNGDWLIEDLETGDFNHFDGDNERVIAYKPYEEIDKWI